MGISYRRAVVFTLVMGISQAETKMEVEDAAAHKEGECLALEAAWEGEKSDKGGSSVNVELNLDAEEDEAT